MFLRDPSKYKYTTDNIIVGNAELHIKSVRGRNGWATLGGGVIFDRPDAVKYARQLNRIIQHNTRRVMAARNPRA